MSDAPNSYASDLLYGAPAIAAYLSMTDKQVYHLHEKGSIPTFKVGKTVCARRSSLANHFAGLEAAAARASRAGDSE